TNLRLNHCWSFFSKVGICARFTFGNATFAIGPWLRPEYGWCAQASNLRFGCALATSCAKKPGAIVSCEEVDPIGRWRPRGDVSPMPTLAFASPALIPAM